MSADHAPSGMLARYAMGDDLPVDAEWALEVHLESCAGCRGRLRETIDRHCPDIVDTVEGVWAAVAAVAQAEPPVRRRRLPALLRWAAPAALPWLAMAVLVPLAAMVLDLAALAAGDGRSARPSVLLLIAPIVPMLSVAVSWSRYLDPAHELVASAPRSGLGLAMRRTLAALVCVMPPLAAAGAVVGTAPWRWLVPSLAFVVGALALGAFIGVGRASVAVATGWVCFVVAPSLISSRSPAVLDPRSIPVWAACALVAAGAIYLWRDPFQRATSHR